MSIYGDNSLARLAGLLASNDGQKLAVWQKGRPIQGYDAAIWRHDAFGHVMRYSDYGDRNSKYGWEIDHIVPLAMGGTDDLSNLRPLQCTNNATLGGLLGGALKRHLG